MRKAALIILALFVVPSAFANATYIFTGTASGTIGSTSFSDDTLTVTLSGPLSAVTTFSEGYMIFSSSASFTIGGIGSGTFTGTTYVFDNTLLGWAGFGDDSAPMGCCDTLQMHDSDMGSTAFATYNLQSSIGPVGAQPTDPSVVQWVDLPTSLGAFALASFDDISFQAKVNAATPEPPALVLFGLGLVLVFFAAGARKNL